MGFLEPGTIELHQKQLLKLDNRRSNKAIEIT